MVKTTSDMVNHFYQRTHTHIDLVKKYLQQIINSKDINLDISILKHEYDHHDESKFENPEYTPYVLLTWNYHLKDTTGKEIDYSDKLKECFRQATFHHIKKHPHHPEYWDENATIESINKENRDIPSESMVYASKMPLSYIACMVADWLAVSEERDSCPFQWAIHNINSRWEFNDEQVQFILELIEQLWKK